LKNNPFTLANRNAIKDAAKNTVNETTLHLTNPMPDTAMMINNLKIMKLSMPAPYGFYCSFGD